MVVAEDIDKLDAWVRHPNTPGRKRRRYLDVLTALRQAGLAWPPLSKKELRHNAGRKEGRP